MDNEEQAATFGLNDEGYGIINQNELDSNTLVEIEEESSLPYIPRNMMVSSERGKGNILINLALFGAITLAFTILFMSILSKSDTNTSTEDLNIRLNIANAISLLHTTEGLHCPDTYSFSPVQLKCLRCHVGCSRC